MNMQYNLATECKLSTLETWYTADGYVDINNPTSLVLFSIPGIPGPHQLTGVVLISMDRGQNILAINE